jgi:hypothetical protein
MFIVTVDIVCSLDLTSSVALTTTTTNKNQYYTTDPQTDGILVLVQDEGHTTREI